MRDAQTNTGPVDGELTCTWVAVTDAAGRTRMEARWSAPAAVPAATPAPHAA